MNIVIVESPAKAKTINKYLGASYEVLASFGHVRDLPAKNGSVDPEANFQMIWEVDPKAAGRLNDIAIRLQDNVERVIVGKTPVIESVLVAIFSQGHILIEDVPGIGKTTLARSIAQSLGCSFKRIQFTPDLIPADLVGINFYNQRSGEFEFRPGPILPGTSDPFSSGSPIRP